MSAIWQIVLTALILTSFGLFVFMGNHLLNSLIILENLVLLIYLTMIINLSSLDSSISQILLLFVLSVSSASVGLSILVTLARSHGSDLFSHYNLLW